LESVFVTDTLAVEAYWGLDMTKAKYSISTLSKVEEEKFILRMNASNFFLWEKKEYRPEDENELYYRYAYPDP
jgi:hypothetical protein